MRKKWLFAMVLALLLAAIWTLAAGAQGDGPRTVTDDEVNAIARQLFCPVCENTPLDVCSTEACRQWREVIRQKLAEGQSEEEIIQYFIDFYGARVVGEPPREGFNWLVYIIPPLLIALGVGVLIRVAVVWRRAAAEEALTDATASPEHTLDDDYLRRLEEELRKRE
jgi:cytochrome c-type biogenesis protein CcmH